MAIRYGRGDVKQTTTGFRGPLMVQSLTSAKSKFLSLDLTCICDEVARHVPSFECAVGVSAFGSVRSAEDLVQQVLEPSVG